MSVALIYPVFSWQELYTYTTLTQSAILARLSSHTPTPTLIAPSSHTYTYTHCALLTHVDSLRPPRTPTPTLTAPLLGWQSPHAFKIASALVGGLSVYFLLGGLITECVQYKC